MHQPMYKGKRVVLEGGGIEVNGRGTMMIDGRVSAEQDAGAESGIYEVGL